MTKSLEKKHAYAVRREHRLRRDKAAIAIFATLLANELKVDYSSPVEAHEKHRDLAERAILLADHLIDTTDHIFGEI